MIEYRGCKATGHVTNTAILSGRYMAHVLLGHRPRRTVTMAF